MDTEPYAAVAGTMKNEYRNVFIYGNCKTFQLSNLVGYGLALVQE